MSYVPKKSSKKSFTQDILLLLYAHGDVDAPDANTVAVLEDILINYLTDISHQLLFIANRQSTNPKKPLKKIKVEDLCFILRNDRLKLSRLKELIVQLKEIETARKQKDDNVIDKLIEEEKRKRVAESQEDGNNTTTSKTKKRKTDSSDEDEDEEEESDDD